ncbi:Hypothetical protein A7982_02208 [Minicystis rosea]|nr:Hypothetical protein A7982_02208 [Minicystis rosea]
MTKRYWYGWQSLIVFGVSTTITIVPSVLGGAVVGLPLGIGGLVLGGPIVHWANGNVGKGFIGLGVNIGAIGLLGAAGIGIACASTSCSGEWGALGVFLGGTIGGGLGALTAAIIDASVLAYGERSEQTAKARSREIASLLPSVDVRPDRAVFGVMGSF